ncbi:MAG: type III pantothenate kinase [Bacillota bacterium]|nr:type III pantothenate kinase [Bacillota bacterium]
MILATDIGNSNIVFGGIENGKVLFTSRLATDISRLADEYATYILGIFELYNVDKFGFDGAIISSVVPPLSSVLAKTVERVTGKKPLILGPGIKTGLNIRTNNSGELGSDIVANNVAALELYKGPVIVIDMGTATTVSVSDAESNFLGCAIMPGITTSLRALTKKAALLQDIDLEAPSTSICTNTPDSLKAGIVFGTAAAIDGMIDRFTKDLGYKTNVVATGGHAQYIIPYCKSEIVLNPDLLLMGLNIIYNKNI